LNTGKEKTMPAKKKAAKKAKKAKKAVAKKPVMQQK
jgi:hypothetical protein